MPFTIGPALPRLLLGVWSKVWECGGNWGVEGSKRMERYGGEVGEIPSKAQAGSEKLVACLGLW